MTYANISSINRQNKIAGYLVDGLSINETAKRCECSQQDVSYVKNSAKYQQLCYSKAMSQLFSVGVAVAVDTLINIAKDVKSPKQARVSAADKLLSYTGYHLTESGKIDKAPSTMTQAELQERLTSLQNESANRAKPAMITAEAVTLSDQDHLNILD